MSNRREASMLDRSLDWTRIAFEYIFIGFTLVAMHKGDYAVAASSIGWACFVKMGRRAFRKSVETEKLKSLNYQPLSIGRRVVVHNYYVGEFLESWNGETGIVEMVREDGLYFIRLDGTSR